MCCSDYQKFETKDVRKILRNYVAFINITNLSSQVCYVAISRVMYNLSSFDVTKNVKTKSNLYNDGAMDIHDYTYDIYFPHITAALFYIICK